MAPSGPRLQLDPSADQNLPSVSSPEDLAESSDASSVDDLLRSLSSLNTSPSASPLSAARRLWVWLLPTDLRKPKKVREPRLAKPHPKLQYNRTELLLLPWGRGLDYKLDDKVRKLEGDRKLVFWALTDSGLRVMTRDRAYQILHGVAHEVETKMPPELVFRYYVSMLIKSGLLKKVTHSQAAALGLL